jgi:hypothetical protein
MLQWTKGMSPPPPPALNQNAQIFEVVKFVTRSFFVSFKKKYGMWECLKN